MSCLTAPAARAGTYSAPAYSGGPWYGPGQNGTPGTNNDAAYNGGWGGGSGGGKSATCQGNITAAFTWVPASGQTAQSDPPPQTVIVTETSQTGARGASSPPGAVGGSCADGFGHSQSLTQAPIYASPGSTQQIGTSGSASLSGVRYSSQSGAVPSVSASPASSASASSTASSDLTYTVGVTPVTITPGGAVQDSGGNWDILVG